jgi:hypothetical protein
MAHTTCKHQVVAVNTGPLPNEELLGAGADLIFPSMTELSRQCQRLLPTL